MYNSPMRIRNTILFTVFLAAACSLLAQPPYEHEYLVKVGDPAPDFTIRQADGKSYSLSDLRGNVVMLQFTASWCSVCRGEMPFIEKEIWQAWRDRGLHVIGIDRDEPVETVSAFARDVGISYPLALDPGAEIFARYAEKDSGVTRNVIVDREGKIIFLTRLFDRQEFDKMKARIDRELVKGK